MCNRVLSEDPFLIKHTLIPLFLSDFWLDILNLKNAKNLNKMIREELMLIDGAIILPERWWNFWMKKTRKKKQNRFLLSNAFNVYNLRLLEHFVA